MPVKKIKPLGAEQLRLTCDPAQFRFKTTQDIEAPLGFLGQARAIEATHLGIGMGRKGFNIFAMGPLGIGKRSVILSILNEEAKKRPAPKDVCYIHNFKDPKAPLLLLLEPGMGKELAEDMRQLVEILRTSIAAIFESDAYTARMKEIREELQKKEEQALSKLEKEATDREVAIIRTGQGFVLAATKNGEILSQEVFQTLSEKEKAKKTAVMQEMQEELAKFLEQVPQWGKEEREKIKEAVKYFTMLQVGSIIKDVLKKYKDQPEVYSYLTDVQRAILENPSDFQRRSEAKTLLFGFDDSSLNRYKVNVLVDNSVLKGAPVIVEDNPTFTNLMGRIDHVSQFGTLVTDFTCIRSGALARANGGFLVLDALKVLTQPYTWDGLKRALRSAELRMENIGNLMGLLQTATIEPSPLPLDLKVVLLGDRRIYYLLCALDPEFLELFKVAADFDDEVDRTAENNHLLAKLLGSLSRKDNLKPLTPQAVAEIIEQASRTVSDTQKISTHIRLLSDLLHEADHYASLRKKSAIDRADVEKVIEQRAYRASRIRQKQYENIFRKVILIDTKESAVGQANGLSYIQLGEFAFGYPVRITARVGVGEGQLVDIEREVELSGPIHSKGVLILTGFLNGKFAKKHPLSLSASLVFEQTYGEVEGDSASVAEACVLLSAIAEIPLKQSIALTGSLNQHGQIQAIGGVNEKIEGFFDICKESFSEGQGVIIPKANIDRLMLRKDVVEASKLGRFHIYAVDEIDQAIEILTGLEAGVRDKSGNFPKESFNGRVDAALELFASEARKRAIKKTSKAQPRSLNSAPKNKRSRIF